MEEKSVGGGGDHLMCLLSSFTSVHTLSFDVPTKTARWLCNQCRGKNIEV